MGKLSFCFSTLASHAPIRFLISQNWNIFVLPPFQSLNFLHRLGSFGCCYNVTHHGVQVCSLKHRTQIKTGLSIQSKKCAIRFLHLFSKAKKSSFCFDHCKRFCVIVREWMVFGLKEIQDNLNVHRNWTMKGNRKCNRFANLAKCIVFNRTHRVIAGRALTAAIPIATVCHSFNVVSPTICKPHLIPK